MRRLLFAVATLVLALTAALFFFHFKEKSHLGLLYSRAASHLEAERNPVIVIPGILGSKLVDSRTRKVVWGAFGGNYVKPSSAEGARLAALPMEENVPVRSLRDDVVPDGALDRFRLNLWFLNFRLSAYYNILRALGIGGYRDEDIDRQESVDYGQEHFTCFQFDYDWRLDLTANAERLDQFIKEKRAYVSSEIRKRFGNENPDVRFDIVAHSMGGLLARYYLRYGTADLPADGSKPVATWAGARHVKRLIMVATPNAGSVTALHHLIKGFGDVPFVPQYGPVILGTMPSLYQLLPQTRHRAVVRKGDPDGEPLDIYDPDLWITMKWGLASRDGDQMLRILLPEVGSAEERRRIALVHLRKCLSRAARLWEALNSPAHPPEGLSLNLFAGDAVLTGAVMAVDMKTGAAEVTDKAPGDGTVLRSSALLDDRLGGEWSSKLRSPIAWDKVMFLFADHLGMTKDKVFTDNILFMLLEEPEVGRDL